MHFFETVVSTAFCLKSVLATLLKQNQSWQGSGSRGTQRFAQLHGLGATLVGFNKKVLIDTQQLAIKA